MGPVARFRGSWELSGSGLSDSVHSLSPIIKIITVKNNNSNNKKRKASVWFKHKSCKRKIPGPGITFWDNPLFVTVAALIIELRLYIIYKYHDFLDRKEWKLPGKPDESRRIEYWLHERSAWPVAGWQSRPEEKFFEINLSPPGCRFISRVLMDYCFWDDESGRLISAGTLLFCHI